MEEEHRQKLEPLFLDKFLQKSDEPVIDLHLHDKREIQETLENFMPEDVLVMAANFENDARNLYLILANKASIGSSTRDLFLKLAEKEAQHKYIIESQLNTGI